MPKALTNEILTQYDREGYFFPHKVLDDQQVSACREKLEEFERSQGKPIGGAQRNKTHLLFKWVDDLKVEAARVSLKVKRQPRSGILDQVLGLHDKPCRPAPPIACWAGKLHCRDPKVLWHLFRMHHRANENPAFLAR